MDTAVKTSVNTPKPSATIATLYGMLPFRFTLLETGWETTHEDGVKLCQRRQLQPGDGKP